MPGTNNTLNRFYPTLDTVVNTDDIPDALGFIKDGIETLLEKVHFKDLQYSKSPRGDAAFYSLSIVSKKRIDIEIPGTGIFLILNPDIDGDQNISAFPITIEYEWKVLAYLRSFNLDQFDFSPRAFFETALRILSISEEQAIANFINTFTEPVDNTSLQQFVADLNNFSNLNGSGWVLLTPTQETKITEVVQDIYAKAGDYATIIAFANYILKNDLNETKVKLKIFFNSLLPQDIEEYIKDILIPKIATSLTLTAGIEFPRNMLQPVYDKDGVNPFNPLDIDLNKALEPLPAGDDGSPRASFYFGEATFYAGTEGFDYEMDIAIGTTSPVMIGNTGLILNIDRFKIDLSDTKNIPEADADGRPASFKGVYADEVSILLPKKWFDKDENDSHPATTAKIGAYNMLIGSGGLSGTIALEAIQIASSNVTSYYEDCFNFQYPIEVTSDGTPAQGVPITLLEFTNVGANINLRYHETLRLYPNVEMAAAMIGALNMFNNLVESTGFAYGDASCYPSALHVNGESVDTRYQTTTQLNVDFINALLAFGFGVFRIGKVGHSTSNNIFNHSDFAEIRTDIFKRDRSGNLHSTHLHSENLVLKNDNKTL